MTTFTSLSQNQLQFEVGQTVLRAITAGRSALLETRIVTRIEGGKLYLDNSKVAIQYPNRLWILT